MELIKYLNAEGLDWELDQTITRGWEFYFIKHELDQHRAKEVNDITVKVFRTAEDGTMGTASATIPLPSVSAEMKKEEMEALAKDLAYRASLVKNKPYKLLQGDASRGGQEQPMERPDIPSIAKAFIEALRGLPETETEFINSYEIFVEEKLRRFRNSAGIDVSEIRPESFAEVVINARRDGHEIELYRSYDSGTCDGDALKEDLTRAMGFGRDRLLAEPTPALGSIDVLFSTADAVNIYEFFTYRLLANLIYQQYSDWAVGENVAPDAVGDKLTVTALKELPNSSENKAFDEEGAPITDTVVMEDFVPKAILGNRMFSQYMGLEHSFIPSNYRVTGGTRTEEELRSGRYLEAVEFSDFQVDEVTGDIFGEIRLGYLHDGDQVKVVTGGSVSGSMFDFIKDFMASKALRQYDEMEIPALTRLKNVTVTGIEKE
ncbi:MAG: TldD/PmbA family protein [Lachnospiraceae bacterium]|nr:TldD/PmbA family protein [Lachnospiraceae bacterium]